MILERLGEDEIQLLTMWILSYIILGVTMPPLGFLLGTDPSEERTQFHGSDGLLPTITLPPLSHDENVDWEVVDLSPAPSTVVLPSLRPAIPVWNSDVAVVEEECEDDSIVVEPREKACKIIFPSFAKEHGQPARQPGTGRVEFRMPCTSCTDHTRSI